MHFHSQAAPVTDVAASVPAQQFIQFPFNAGMLFTNLFVRFGRRSLFGGFVLRLKIVFADFAMSLFVCSDTLIAQRAVRALAGFEVVNPAVFFPVTVTGFSRFSVGAA